MGRAETGSSKITSGYFFESEGVVKKTAVMESLRRKMPAVLIVMGVALMISGFLINYIKVRTSTTTVNDNGSVRGVSGESFSQKRIMVHIDGAVERPGVYTLPNDSRIQDVLISAGGLSAKADRNYISKNINLSQRAYDGMKIYFPEINDANTNTSNVVNLDAGNIDTDTGVGINSATQAQLEALPGIGPVTAKKIIENRPYSTLTELVEKKVVGLSTYRKIEELITLN